MSYYSPISGDFTYWAIQDKRDKRIYPVLFSTRNEARYAAKHNDDNNFLDWRLSYVKVTINFVEKP